ncbi:spinster family MFS transporter [Craterilacuibacter sinensis]|uniref:MFS transporter n=1 Tax=Craterilacuibacter sinensis TaxID=2686017 RepID=A0A845BLH2_9NEIS|nr:MFS transporter [Craterilacuibacter sinensis]MXR37517.1 MFS transporter [Craterilacuibacter sinensis]
MTETLRPGWRSHYALALVALAYVFNYVDRLLMSILIEPVKLEFGVSDTEIGLLSGLVFGLCYSVAGLPLGRLADRIGAVPVIACCAIAFSVFTMLCGLAGSFAVLLLCRIGVAFAEAGGMAPSVALVSQLYPPRQRSRALAAFMMGPSLGTLVGLAAGGWIAHHYGWRMAFIAIGLPGALIGILIWLTVRNVRVPRDTAASAGSGWWPSTQAILATPGYIWLLASASLAAICGYAVGTWNPSFLIRSHNLTMQQAGLLAGVGGGVMSFAGTLACGWATDRLVQKDAGWQVGTALAGTLLSIPFALGYYLWPAGSALVLMGIAIPEAFLLYLGFAFFGVWWSIPCLGAISHLFPAGRIAQATSVFVAAMTLFGIGAGPLVAGTLSDLFTPSYGDEALRYALAASVSLLALASVTLALALPSYRRARQIPALAIAHGG